MSACMNSEGGDDVMCLSDHSESETTFEDFVNSLPLREPGMYFRVSKSSAPNYFHPRHQFQST
jgi:hypothetical protein